MKRWREIGKVVFIATILAATVFICLAVFQVYNTLTELERLRAALTHVARDAKNYEQVQQQYRALATGLTASTQELDGLLIACVVGREPAQLTQFRAASDAARRWMEAQQKTVFRSKIIIEAPVTFTIELGRFADEAAAAQARYLREASLALEQVERAGGSAVVPTNLTATISAAHELLGMASQGQARAEVLELFLSGSRAWLPPLQAVVSQWLPQLVGLLFLATALAAVSLAGLLALMFYRLVIAPLRSRIHRREALIEKRHQLADLGELAAGLAHEIRNPLTAINARLFTLQHSLAPGAAADQDAHIIRNEVKRLDRIVRDFLDLARPAEPRFERVAAADLLREARDLLGPTLEKQDIALTVDAADDVVVRVDPHQIKQVLINLIQNAAESLGQDGAIVLRARAAETAQIEVEDDGAGVPAANRAKLFDPFFSTKDGGTGLGLAIAARILTQHDGRLDYRPAAHGGAIFRLTLPRNPAPPEADGAHPDR